MSVLVTVDIGHVIASVHRPNRPNPYPAAADLEGQSRDTPLDEIREPE